MNAASTFVGKFQQGMKKEDASLIELLAAIIIGIFGVILSELKQITQYLLSWVLLSNFQQRVGSQ